jgi:hypothetical protein
MKFPSVVFVGLLAATIESSAQTPTRVPTDAPKRPAPTALTTEPLEIGLGETIRRDAILLLNLGNVAVGQTVSLTLSVSRPAGGADAVWLFCEGYLRCQWTDGSRTDEGRILKHEDGLKVTFTASEPRPAPSYIVINNRTSHVLNWITVDYTLFPKRVIPFDLSTPGYISGNGKRWGPWYDVCSGAAPPAYHLLPERVRFEVSGDDGRGCGAWVNCEGRQNDSANVCWRFQIQGKEYKLFQTADETKNASARLHVEWELSSQPATLVPPPPK